MLGLFLLAIAQLGLLAPQIAAARDENEQNLAKRLWQSWHVLRDSRSDHGARSEAITGIFEAVESVCVKSCAAALEIVRDLNDRTGLKPVEYFVARFPKVVRQFFPDQDVEAFIAPLQRFFLALPQGDLEYRVKLSLELLRYLISIKEEMLFKLQDGTQSPQEAVAVLARDLSFMTEQMVALYEIRRILLSAPNGSLDLDETQWAAILAEVNKLGLFYQKLLQTFSNNSYLLSPGARKVLAPVRQNIPPMPADEVLSIMQADLGRDPREIYVDFDAAKPFASGTIAQTYRAKIRRGNRLLPVMVKVRRPGLEVTLNANHHSSQVLGKLAKLIFPAEFAPLVDILMAQVNGLEHAFKRELDFPRETDRIEEYGREFAAHTSVSIPKVYREVDGVRYCGESVITMEDLGGNSLDLDGESAGVSPAQREVLFKVLLDSFLYQFFILGKIHADLHPGNVLALANNKIGLIDWGEDVKTKNLMLLPTRLALALSAGQLEKTAQALLEIQGESQLSIATIREFVSKGFADHKIRAIPATDWIFHGQSNHFDEVMMALTSILNRMILKGGYMPSPRYLQLARTLLPVLSSLTQLAEGMPKSRVRFILVSKLATLFPKGIFLHTVANTMQLPRWIWDALKPAPASCESPLTNSAPVGLQP